MNAFAKFLVSPALLLPILAGADEGQLPRVLILGDSVYQEPAKEAANLLKARVEIHHAALGPGEVLHTGIAPHRLDELLGEKKWDLVYFNFGLGDLLHKVPGIRSIRALPIGAGGIRVTPPDQYEKNLQGIAARLQKTGAKLVWASTTPIRHSATQIFEPGSEVEYNAIAAKVMSDHGIQTFDMYGHVLALIDMTKPAPHGSDPFFFDKNPLHPPIVEIILKELKVP